MAVLRQAPLICKEELTSKKILSGIDIRSATIARTHYLGMGATGIVESLHFTSRSKKRGKK
jgi:NO-binding membrane sensor protein with MHYT domain